jgi:hypothetical protein
MAGKNFEWGVMAENKINTYGTTNKEKKMVLDWPYTTEITRCSRKTQKNLS